MSGILLQAGRYGNQIRLLEDRGLLSDGVRVFNAWRTFLDQFEGTDYLAPVKNAYLSSYLGR